MNSEYQTPPPHPDPHKYHIYHTGHAETLALTILESFLIAVII